MIDHRPHLLPKMRSDDIMRAMNGYPCTLRIAGFIPGHSCAPDRTVVGAHLPVVGKGIGTKVTDLAVVAACAHCHDLLDGRDARIGPLSSQYPAALHMRYLNGLVETHALLARDGIIAVTNGRLV